MKHKTLTNWLLINSILIFAVGVYMTFFKDTTIYVFKPLVETVFWPDAVVNNIGTQHFRSFIYSLCGVIMVVWGLLMFSVVKNAVAKNEKWAIDALLVSVLVWFPIDEFFSIKYEVWYNAIFNTPLFLSLIIPLALLRYQLKNK
jgi:hypothetical protein